MIAFQDLKLAYRNVFRNTRRSLVTIIAIMLSCAGLILFAGYVAWAFKSAESQAVVIFSHLQLARPGFYEKGAGNPTVYAISSFGQIKQLLQDDPVIGSKLQLVSAQTIFKGIVSYSAAHTSSTFVGLGVFPEDDWALLHWNPYKLTSPLDLPANKALYGSAPELSSDDPEGATIGIGLALRCESAPKAGQLIKAGLPVLAKRSRSCCSQPGSNSRSCRAIAPSCH